MSPEDIIVSYQLFCFDKINLQLVVSEAILNAISKFNFNNRKVNSKYAEQQRKKCDNNHGLIFRTIEK